MEKIASGVSILQTQPLFTPLPPDVTVPGLPSALLHVRLTREALSPEAQVHPRDSDSFGLQWGPGMGVF